MFSFRFINFLFSCKSRGIGCFTVSLSRRYSSQINKRMPTALVLLSEGAEEMEVVITADVLVRGGVDVTLAGLLGPAEVKCSRGIMIKPHTSVADVRSNKFDVVICPGGLKGAENLASSDVVKTLLENQIKNNSYIAAICAGPTAFLSHGIAKGSCITSHPSVKDKLSSDYKYSEERVVHDGKVITSRGPGTCFEFGLKLVEILQGKEKADSLKAPMLLKD